MKTIKKVLGYLKDYGMDVYKIKDLEKTDEKIKELIDQKYDTIVISNEVASFSEDIIKKYGKVQNVNIIIAPGKISNWKIVNQKWEKGDNPFFSLFDYIILKVQNDKNGMKCRLSGIEKQLALNNT